MKKTLIVFIVLSATLFGVSFTQFKRSVLNHSKLLKSNRLSLSAADQENKIMLRSKNPTLEVEASRFNPDAGDDRMGYRGTYSQPIRTGGYYDALTQTAQARTLLRQAYVSQGRAGFIKELERFYTNYVYLDHLNRLMQKDYEISGRIASAAHERFKGGAESRAQYLRAKTEVMIARTEMLSLKRETKRIYYQMLGLAGLGREVSLEKKFIYSLSPQNSIGASESPLSRILLAKKERFAAEVEANDRTFKSFSLYGELEKEPDQSIARVGVSFPIPFFNQNREEKALAKIKMRQTELDREQLIARQAMQKKSLAVSISELNSQYYALKKLEREQNELLGLFEEGYRISKGSLMDLMITKRRLIETRKEMLKTKKVLNEEKIELNYIQGKYND